MPIDLLADAPPLATAGPRDLLASTPAPSPSPATPRDVLAGTPMPDNPRSRLEQSLAGGNPYKPQTTSPTPTGLEGMNIQLPGERPQWAKDAADEVAHLQSTFQPFDKTAIFRKHRDHALGGEPTVKDYLDTPLHGVQAAGEKGAQFLNAAVGDPLANTGQMLLRSAGRATQSQGLMDAAQQSKEGYDQSEGAYDKTSIVNRVGGSIGQFGIDYLLAQGTPQGLGAMGALRGFDSSKEAGGSDAQALAHAALGGAVAAVRIPGAQKLTGAILGKLPGAVADSALGRMAVSVPTSLAENTLLTGGTKAVGNLIDQKPAMQGVFSKDTLIDSIGPGIIGGVHAGLAHGQSHGEATPAVEPVEQQQQAAPRDLLADHVENAIDAQDQQPSAKTGANIPENIPSQVQPAQPVTEVTPRDLLAETSPTAPRDLLADIDTSKTPSVREAVNAAEEPENAAIEKDLQGMHDEDQQAARRARAMAYTPEDLARMDNGKIRKIAQDLGVTSDTRGATIPRILDAQQKGNLTGLSNKDLYWKVKELGGKAGSRQKNLDFLLGYEPPATPAESAPNAVPAKESVVSTPHDEQQARGEESPAGQRQEPIPAEGQRQEQSVPAESQGQEKGREESAAPVVVDGRRDVLKESPRDLLAEKAPPANVDAGTPVHFTDRAGKPGVGKVRGRTVTGDYQVLNYKGDQTTVPAQFVKPVDFGAYQQGDTVRIPGFQGDMTITKYDPKTGAAEVMDGSRRMMNVTADRFLPPTERPAQKNGQRSAEPPAETPAPDVQSAPSAIPDRPSLTRAQIKDAAIVDPSLRVGLEKRLDEHHDSIIRAVQSGKSVPPEVLKDYPGLQPAQPNRQAEQPPRDAAQGEQEKPGDGLRDDGGVSGADKKDDGRRRGFVNLLPVEAAAKAIGRAAKAAPEKTKEAARNIRDFVTIDALPKLSRAGASDSAVEHASARIALPHVVNDLLSRVFPDQYKDPEAMAKTIDVINKDNILAGYDQFREMAKKARDEGDASSARQFLEAADRITDVHDVDAYDAQVRTALNDPTIAGNIERWKNEVNPTLDQLYNEVKRVDPNTERDGRGRHTDARINLLSEESAKEWAEMLGDDDKPMPEPRVANYRNPDVKRDKFDRSAKFTGQYATDPKTVLSAVLGPRLNEATKLRLYDSLKKAGVAVERGPGEAGPAEIDGKGVERLPMQVPQTDPNTGKTTRVEHSLFVREDHVNEIRGVLGTDMRPTKLPFSGLLTKIQLAQLADAFTHLKNQHTTIVHAQGAGSAVADILRRIPLITSGDAFARMWKVSREIAADTPEIREEVAEMAKKGLVRPSYPATGWQKIIKAQDILHATDTATRVIMNRFFSDQVSRGLVKDTPSNRYKFINQVGQYNHRLMGYFSRVARDSGLSPFLVAGRSFSRMGRRVLMGEPGVQAASTAAATQLRLTNHLRTALLFTLPMIANMYTVGTPGGRSGTPLGAVDLGTDDKDGKHKVFDLLQLVGARRGMKSIGADAFLEGYRQGKDLNTMIGDAAAQITQSALHPWMGPAPAFAIKAATGVQPDIRGKMEAQKIPDGGGKQLAENFRAALESQNPLIYSLARPMFQAAGYDQEPDRPKDKPIPTLLKSPAGAVGLKDVPAGTNQAEDMAKRLTKGGSDGVTPEEARVYETRKDLLNALRKDPAAGKKAVETAVENEQITEKQAALLQKKAGVSPFKWTVRSLEAEDAAKVYNVATGDQKAEIRDEVRSKIVKSDLTAKKQDALLQQTGIDAPPDLEVQRELHGLRQKKTAYDKAMRSAREAGDGERKAKYDAAKSLRLKSSETIRLERLAAISEQLKNTQKRVRQGKITAQEGDRQTHLTVEHAMKGKAAATEETEDDED